MYLHNNSPCTRRGASIIEAVVATILMGSLFAVLLPTVVRLQRVGHEVGVRERGIEVLRNVVERSLYGSPLTAEQTAQIESEFPEGKLEVSEHSSDGANRVEMILSWSAGEDRPRPSVHLSYWEPQAEDVQ
ncbi:MAG: hypothetical protein KDA88_11110 [Planctomycetaceae bacterium]|nr:hypothetical protein [Planctomycetaceae bacterium]